MSTVAASWAADVRAGLVRAGGHPGAFIDAEEARRRLPLADALPIVRDAVLWEGAGRILVPEARRAVLRSAVPGVSAAGVEPPSISTVSKCCLVPELGLAGFRFLGSVGGRDPVRYLHLAGLEHGNLLATIDEHLTYLVRIAALAVVVAEYTAPAAAPVIGMIGAGPVAGAVLDAFVEAGRAREIVLTSRRAASRDRLAERLRASGFSRVTALDGVRDVAERADVVITATNAQAPILSAAWVKPGAAVYGLGDAPELDPGLLVRRERGSVRLLVSNWRECGERADFRRLITDGRIGPSDVDAELWEVIAGRTPARADPRDVVCVRAPGSVALDTLLGAWICARGPLPPASSS